jgi:NAD/NADP transhydrogenase beta subunit
MGTILVNYAGTQLSTAKITDITVAMGTKNALIKVHGADKDIVQKMGKMNRLFTLDGFCTGSAGITFLNASLNYTGSLYYSSSAISMELIGTAAAYVMVYYSKLTWHDDGKNPMMRNFSLELIEVQT